MGAPSGRTVLHVVAVFLGVFAFRYTASRSAAPQQSPTARSSGCRLATSSPAPPAAWRKTKASWPKRPRRRQDARLPQVGGEQPQQDIGQVQKDQLFHIQLLHRSGSFLWARSTTALFTSSLNCASFSSTDGRSLRLAFLTFFCVYSEKAAVSASASRALKKIRYLAAKCCGPFSPHSPRRTCGRCAQSPGWTGR